MKASVQFQIADKIELKSLLPILFEIIHINMEKIAPSGYSCEESKRIWCECFYDNVLTNDELQVVLFYKDSDIVGFAAYSVKDQVFKLGEIQIKEEYQRTLLFYYFCKFMKSILPKDLLYIEGFANKSNLNSQSVMKSAGMVIIGTNQSGKSYHFRGDIQKLFEKF